MISLLEKKVRNFYIINISSGAVFTKNKKLSIYTLTKNFIHNLIEYLNIENDKNFIKKKRYINFIPPSFFSKMNQKLIRYNVLKNKKKIKKPDIVAKNLIKLIESLKWD
jgi:short-subunit dehydrogenase